MSDQNIFQQVAKIHISSIDQGFLSTLGENFLTLLYQSIDECKCAKLLVEQSQGRVIGFVCGTTSMRPIYKQLLAHFPQLMVVLFPIILNPRKIWHIIEIIFNHRSQSTNLRLTEHELLSIAVLQKNMRQGVAQRLYGRLVDYFHEEGAPEFHIIVGKNLKTAQIFYSRMGAKPVMEVSMHNHEKSLVFVHNLKRKRGVD